MSPSPAALLAPVFALAFWTFLVLLRLAFVRIRAGLCGQISPGDFRLGESPQVPAPVTLVNRNYMNLLELPVLFYALSLILVAQPALAGPWAPGLQWAYVGLRIAHSVVHQSYNNVLHRLAVFAASNAVLVTLWMLAALRLTLA